ncbi:polyprenyl synthetase family protein [Syntrophothermus lipocalidus]|uniref:Farnesyl diphosphate synthase n=1 Tax=Syntrophothermus lipocalidus (strain DSM 12680 / TGB-C1) TaxID=643648 RepID=D7CKI2_SYNLT|nr:farnesyl diphosphate synthase [Syntrophothermus lipocalidus]ADI01217.1 Polyprenyl synthetase [Syntrophothermus lipocalidus DSM 12680]
MGFNVVTFEGELADKKAYVEKFMREFMPPENAYPQVIHRAMHYAVFNGGKRLRPILVLESAQVVGKDLTRALPVACAMEMIHSYSLVHDDLPAMDDDDLRRGKPTCHKVFGEANAILTGDALLTLAFEIMTACAELPGMEPRYVAKVVRETARAVGSLGMVGGQVLDLELEGKDTDFFTLKTLHSKKTGALFRACLRAGALLFGVEDERLQALTRYAENFGLAFQITDDILDVEGDEKITGKPVGSDEKKQKVTYPSLLGMDEAKKLAKSSVEEAVESLNVFGAEADFLRNLALYLLHRRS